MVKSISYDLDILLKISKQNENLSQFSDQREYLNWFLEACTDLIPSSAGLILANVQYISPLNPPRYAGGSISGIPSLMDLNVLDLADLREYLAGTMAFLTAVRLLDSPETVAVQSAIEQFRRKFIVQISSLPQEHLPQPVFSRLPSANMLSMKVPLPQLPPEPINFFRDRIQCSEDFIAKRLGESRVVMDGPLFDRLFSLPLANERRQEFEGQIFNFLAIVCQSRHFEQIYRRMIEETRAAGVAIEADICKGFILTGALHAWLKSPAYTVMIPLTFTMFPQGPPALGIFLLNSQNELSVEDLNKLHLALGMGMKALTEIEVREMPQPVAGERLGAEAQRLIKHAEASLQRKWQQHLFCDMIGASEEMAAVFRKVETVARHDDTDVLIIGESGSGKEGIARAIHQLSGRNSGPFVAVSLADRPDTLVESELFGHEKGAFTGAIKQRKGYFELANGGTLFLDEICHISPNVQTKLLRVLQNRTVQRLGGGVEIPVDVRVISATSKNLANEMLREKLNFIDPLYYRLQEYVIIVPPLRERSSDIPLLADYFLSSFHYNDDRQVQLSEDALHVLMEYHWPGNVRQLMNIIKRAFINAYDDGLIRRNHFELESLEGNGSPKSNGLEKRLEEVLEALRSNRFNIEHTERYMAARNAFHPNRKTLIRHCRELCLWHLAHHRWNLREAVRAVAAHPELEAIAAQKFKHYFFGDKQNTGLVTLIRNGEFEKNSLVRRPYQAHLRQFAVKLKNREIDLAAWQSILEGYLTH